MSLSCFVYAEMPELEALERDFPKHQRDVIEDEILPRLRKHFGSSFQANVHRVGKLYEEIIDLISNERRIPDSMFDESSYEFQASWDEWGRGYKSSPRQLDAQGSPQGEAPRPGHNAIVQIDRMATRADAVKALQALATQGEAPHLRDPDLPDSADEVSHFKRFLDIYDQFKKERDKDRGWSPAAGVPSNPSAREDLFGVVAAPTGRRPAARRPRGYTSRRHKVHAHYRDQRQALGTNFQSTLSLAVELSGPQFSHLAE